MEYRVRKGEKGGVMNMEKYGKSEGPGGGLTKLKIGVQT